MTKVAIDAIDRKILQYLITNARMPFLEIARECGISGAAIHQRVKKLDDAGIILGSRLEVDPVALGFGVCAFIGIRVSDPLKNLEAVEAIKQVPEVVECHFITGQFGILVKMYCTDNEHLMRIIFSNILTVTSIAYTETFISLNQAFSRQVNVQSISIDPQQ